MEHLVEFRVDKIEGFNHMEQFKKLRSKVYRLLICYENQDKNGKPTKEHYHGWCECSTNIKCHLDQVRSIIKVGCQNNKQYAVRTMKQNPKYGNDYIKTALAYCFKQQNLILEYNISYTLDDLVAHWQFMKGVWCEEKQAKVDYKDEVADYIKQFDSFSLDEIKLSVARKMVSDKKLPTLGKVRSYALYGVLKNNLKISDFDLYKCI